MSFKLYDYQTNALRKLKTGKILCGGVGSGKSRTGLSWYYISNGGIIDGSLKDLVNQKPLYIITTAKKRDSLEWEEELYPFKLYPPCEHNVTIDSWNNIKKYTDISDSFFLFDEQRVVGKGSWVDSFLEIAKKNSWILLTATPGDVWTDYIPVFLANGFYKNRTDFMRQHCIINRICGFPKIDRFISTNKLERLRNEVLIEMDYSRPTEQHHIDIYCDYSPIIYKDVIKDRWDPYNNEPIKNASGLCYILRKIVNDDPSRLEAVNKILNEKKRAIIFYNYDYELFALREYCEARKALLGDKDDFDFSEWNGYKHENIRDSKSWAYLVQYAAGAEGWQCTSCDTIIFFSQNYSYKTMVQASGRIDRLNTQYKDLYYYHLKSKSSIDISIARALAEKKKFNERKFANFN